MARYPTLGGERLLNPGVLYGEAIRNGTPIDFWQRATSYRCPLGPEPGECWVLMERHRLDKLDKNDWHTLKWIDGNRTLEIPKLSIVKSSTMAKALTGAKDAPRLVHLQDKRRQMAMSSINKQYNVRRPAPSATSGVGLYYGDSLNGGSLWTWQTLVTNLWTNFPSSIRGTAPTLPYSPDGTPEGWRFVGVNAWESLHDVLHKIGCTTSYDPIGDSFSIVQLGTTQSNLRSSFARIEDRRIYDYDPGSDYQLSNMPETVRVFFHRRETYHGIEKDTPNATNWEMTPAVPKDYATGVTGAIAGSVHAVWDDLPALYDATGANTNAAALQTRADEVGENIANRIDVAEEPGRRMYGGIVADILPGSEVSEVIWRDFGDNTIGLVTEIVNRMPKIADAETPAKPPAEAPQYPLYPRVSQLVQVDDGASATGTELTANGDGLFPGYVVRWAGSAYEQLEACWIRPADLEGASEATVSDLKQKDRLVGRLYGNETSGGTTLPIYLVRRGTSEASPDVYWGYATTNWVRPGGGACDYVPVQVAADCPGSSPTGATINVLLPQANESDPNVIQAEVVAFRQAADATYVAVSDYMDDKIGCVKMFTGVEADIPLGWALMDGNANASGNGGSGINLSKRFVRSGAQAGARGGKESHNHEIDVIIDVDLSTWIAIADAIFDNYTFTIPDHSVADLLHYHTLPKDTVSLGWESLSVTWDGAAHSEWTEDQAGTLTCSQKPVNENDCISTTDWGPLAHTPVWDYDTGGLAAALVGAWAYSTAESTIHEEKHIPPYTDLLYIERIDNSV